MKSPVVNAFKNKILKGMAWTVSFRFGQRFMGLVSTLILVRILAPKDFGIVAMGMAVGAVLDAISSFGFDQAIIQRKEIDRTHLDTAWTINQIVSAIATVVLLLLAPVVAAYYGDPRVINVIIVLAIGVALTGVQNFPGMTMFEREMNFRPVFIMMMSAEILSTAVTIVLAFVWRDYRALLAGLFTFSFTKVTLGFVLSPYRPRWSLSAAREMLQFTRWLLLNNLITAVSNRGQDALIGRHLGAASTGAFSVANEVAHLPTTEMIMPFMRAIYPAFVKIRDGTGDLLWGFTKVSAIVFLIITPTAVGIACLSDLIVAVILGAKWFASTPLLPILGVLGSLQACRAITDPVLLASGKPRMIATLSLLFVATAFPAFALLLWTTDLTTATWGLVFGGLVSVVAGFSVALTELGGRWAVLLVTLVRPLVGSAVLAAAVIGARALLPRTQGSLSSLPWMLALILLGAAVYAGAVLTLWRLAGKPDGAERELLDTAGRFLQRIRRQPTAD
ncbi:MAG TPA: oligosaccharide flippase family protein [Candidatus Eisenbacteria bacterium]|nr:oligosaccharide flippase family protein [Candidatus Eisenbacteria bacterium]